MGYNGWVLVWSVCLWVWQYSTKVTKPSVCVCVCPEREGARLALLLEGNVILHTAGQSWNFPFTSVTSLLPPMQPTLLWSSLLPWCSCHTLWVLPPYPAIPTPETHASGSSWRSSQRPRVWSWGHKCLVESITFSPSWLLPWLVSWLCLQLLWFCVQWEGWKCMVGNREDQDHCVLYSHS